MARSLIRNPKPGEKFGLNPVTDYRRHYEARGFVIPDEQPHGWTAPKIKAESALPRATKAAAGTNDGAKAE